MEFQEYVNFLNSELTVIKGVGEKKSALFAKLGINCVWDLLYYFPYEHEDRRSFYKIATCPDNKLCCIKAIPKGKLLKKNIRKNIALFTLTVADNSGLVNVKFFSNPYYKISFDLDTEYVFFGRMVTGYGKREFEMKSYEKSGGGNTGVMLPVYHASAGLGQNVIRKTVRDALGGVDYLVDSLPESVISRYNLCTIDEAVRQMHLPDSEQALARARARLVFEELFVLQLALMFLKSRRTENSGLVFQKISVAADFAKKLPFELTDSQKQVINEICTDFRSGKPMNRLLQGDVGSGKTVVAAAVMYTAHANGYQSAMMAPTEILAQQHYNTLTSFFGDSLNIALLTGSTGKKKKLLADIKDGKYDIVVGTHALIEGNVEFANLGLCITDEQHRFGVNQRARLFEKGMTPHVLVMSATPIPRTLSLILYGDLDVSIINTLPKGREPIDTFCVKSDMHNRVYGFVKKQLDEGRQCYVVCPLVEKSDTMDVTSSVEFEEELRSKVLPGYRIGLLHGKMKAAQKDEIMTAFKNLELDLLVSTTVIEVGVDVPNANIIVIENAERFGLSQLHQLRGRVGRGQHKSYCILVTDADNKETSERMSIMTATNDGFKISQKDLELRGCGEFFGTRQHGLPELKVANLFTDIDVLKLVQQACGEILAEDPLLESGDMAMIRARIQKLFAEYDNFNIFN
ncbi:MAG: ATP-dependent DNA helicase RecG [Clostridia bacterium]|nr:ATP-dependent DNA helicase RecG [Clostridia bacterium]